MNFSTYQWRADHGYLSPPGHQPAMLYHHTPPLYPAYGPIGYVPVPPPSAMVPRYSAPPPMPSRPSLPPAPTQNAVARPSSRKPNPNRPPELRPGMNMMFSPEYTHLHVFGKSSKIWKEEYHGRVFKFKQFKTATTMTVQHVISNVLNNTDAEYCKNWAVTEVRETGDGVWDKGMKIPFSSDRAKKTLESVGWDKSRGTTRPPVWLVVHEI